MGSGVNWKDTFCSEGAVATLLQPIADMGEHWPVLPDFLNFQENPEG